MRTLKLFCLAIVTIAALMTGSSAQAIENVRGKSYGLRNEHGPWMIMVASFRNVRDEDQRKKGLTAEQAAAELVYELRQQGIPAYTFSQDAKKGEIDTHDRLGRDDHRIYAAQRDMICVLAGNYKSIDDDLAERTRKYIKEFRPRFLADPKSVGAVMRATDKGPLVGAFMTINPMLNPEEVAQRSVDREAKALNSNIQFALVQNPKKYTIRVASFTGKSMTLGASTNAQAEKNKRDKFDYEISRGNTTIDRAGEDATQLTHFLRSKGRSFQSERGGDPFLYEAYVYHNKFESIVTIGGFDSPDDPRIRAVIQHYSPELVPDYRVAPPKPPGVMATDEEIEQLPKVWVTHTERIFAKGANPREAQPLQVWTFEVEPKVIQVPRVR